MVYFSDFVSMVILVIHAYLPMLVNSSFAKHAMENLVILNIGPHNGSVFDSIESDKTTSIYNVSTRVLSKK